MARRKITRMREKNNNQEAADAAAERPVAFALNHYSSSRRARSEQKTRVDQDDERLKRRVGEAHIDEANSPESDGSRGVGEPDTGAGGAPATVSSFSLHFFFSQAFSCSFVFLYTVVSFFAASDSPILSTFVTTDVRNQSIRLM